MNQTQTRSLRKKVLSLILAVVMAVSLLPISAFASGDSKASTTATTSDGSDGYEYNIMFLDCGRKYYSVDSIKQIIDNASAAGFNYIQLAVGNDGLRFLLDDMSLTVNGVTYSSDTVSKAIHTGNEKYYNFDVDELTQSEMDEIVAYAATKGMGVIPCVNTPGHMDAILSAANSLTGTTCSYDGSVRTIDVTNTTAVAFTKALLQKYIDYFAGKGCKLFNMGADEYANDKYTGGSMGFGNLQSTGEYSYYVQYVNDVAKMIENAKMTPMAFNDGIYFNNNTSSGTFDTDIIICYWSSGWGTYNPMPASTLDKMGFRLVNTDGSYYWVLGKTDTQCSANKASGFKKNSFPGNSTINTPAGSMFCIWADYPGAETEASVISKTAATIAAFGKALPQVKKVETVESKTVTKDNVTVTAPGLTDLTVAAADAPAIDAAAEGKVVAYNVTPATASGNYKKNGTVTLPIPEGWDASHVRGFVQNEDGSITTVTGTPADGKFTFTVPHFSVLGVYELAADAATKTKTINLTVGGTKEEKLAGDYSGTRLDDAVATVTGSVAEASGKPTYQLATLGAGTFYVSTKSNDTAPTVQLTFENAENGQYYIKNSDGKYVYPDAEYDRFLFWGSWSFNLKTSDSKDSAAPVGVATTDGRIVISRAVTSNSETGTAYLTLRGTTFGAGDNGTSLYLYNQQTGKETTLTFTGKSVGTTTVTIGSVKYNITVTAEDLSKVTPLKLEYWITNASIDSVTGADSESRNKVLESGTYQVYFTNIAAKADGVASEAGVDVTTIAPANTSHKNRTVYYWRCRMLDTTLDNNSTSKTQEQTGDGGDDETMSGVGFTKIRYYGSSWQVFTENNEWVTVDADKNQLIAYYLEYIKVSDEVESFAADWGNRGDGSKGGWLDTSNYCTLSMQVVYEDGTTNPTNTTASALKSKTIVYGYWNDKNGRGVGTILLDGQEYEIYKVTSKTGEAIVSFSGNDTATAQKFTWDDNEMTVWEGDPSSNVSIHNDATGFSTEGANANLCWDENKEAILLRVYVRAKVTEDSLTVNYYDESDLSKPFYDYNISVKKGTEFDEGFARTDDGKLVNNTVTNIKNVQQTVQWDLSQLKQIDAQYRYSDYEFTRAERSADGKTVNLYYKFKSSKTFVVDFGLPMMIRPADMNANLGNEEVSLTKVDITQSTTYANISVDSNKNITYTLNKTINGKDNFGAAYSGTIPKYNESGKLTGTQEGTVKYSITVIPATSVYYEDSFATFTNADSTKNVAQVDNAGKGIWTKVTDGTTQTKVNQALEELGGTTNTKNVYGYDPAYANSSKFSMGSATKVTVAADTYKEGKTQWPTATFTFKGTGFDVISLTDNTSGAIFVDVYKGTATSGDSVKSYAVNNYYSYKQNENGQWVVSKDGNNALYQIPVMKVSGLDYGEYTAVIRVAYSSFFDQTTKNEYNFWLDAIRVYDPMGKDNETYKQDKEGYPQYIKLRDSLVGGTATAETGSVFIDGADKATIDQYKNGGPNNEVYLAYGQAISFTVAENKDIATIQIGAKAPNGTANMTVNNTKAVNGGISTATEMYYKLDVQPGQQVTISNTGDGILSLTNLKITFNSKPTAPASLAALTTADQENAVAQVRALFAEPVEPFNPDRFDASWSRNVRKGETAKLTVKTSEDVEAITVNGETIDSFTERHERTGWGWWAKTVTFREFTYTDTATVTKDYTVCAVNGKGVSSDAITATLTVRPSVRDWLHGIFGKWF